MTVMCKNCWIELFEHDGSARKIFRSFATRKDDEGNDYYLCIDCHEGKNKEYFESKQTD